MRFNLGSTFARPKTNHSIGPPASKNCSYDQAEPLRQARLQFIAMLCVSLSYVC